MKQLVPAAFLILAATTLITSCKKESMQRPAPVTPVAMRTVKFILYTNQDFTGNNANITFSLHIDDGGITAPFDSIVYSTQVKNIPDKAHELVFEKKIPDDGKTLTAGFTYEIQNVGYSWHLDTVASNDKLKVIEYPFQ